VLNWINRFVGLGSVVDKEGRDGSEYLRGTGNGNGNGRRL
jgi:hypothetical protein